MINFFDLPKSNDFIYKTNFNPLDDILKIINNITDSDTSYSSIDINERVKELTDDSIESEKWIYKNISNTKVYILKDYLLNKIIHDGIYI